MHPVLGSRRAGHFLFALWVASACVLVAACSSPAPSSAVAGTAQVTPAADNQPAKVDINAIFPAGRGRDLLLNNCTSCHTFVPIVVLQMDQTAWQRNSRIHRSRVPSLTDEEFEVLYQYLAANFNPDRPVPSLPKSLLETWTTY